MPVRVMLVDDNGIVRRGLLETIEHSDGFTVGQTGESEKALGLAQRLRPDLILLDVLMPGKNGIDVRRDLPAALPDAKVLMLTPSRTATPLTGRWPPGRLAICPSCGAGTIP